MKLLFVMTEFHPGSIAKSKKSCMKKISNMKNTLIINQTFLLLQNINNLQAQIRTLIDISKEKYFSRISQKLESTSKNTKCYWPLLKLFLNNKKIPCIPPLFRKGFYTKQMRPSLKLFLLLTI